MSVSSVLSTETIPFSSGLLVGELLPGIYIGDFHSEIDDALSLISLAVRHGWIDKDANEFMSVSTNKLKIKLYQDKTAWMEATLLFTGDDAVEYLRTITPAGYWFGEDAEGWGVYNPSEI